MDKNFETARLVTFTDGGARGNPGPAGIGIVFYLEDEFGNRQHLKIIRNISASIPTTSQSIPR
jgi:ribonuclease HI